MAHQRNILAGMTDFTGVSLDDIGTHLKDWVTNTDETINALHNHREAAKAKSDLLENPSEVTSFIDYFLDLFGRYRNDLLRLEEEIKRNVTPAHIEIVNQLYQSSKLEEQATITFKNDWVYKSLPHEEMRPLLDDIYGDTRDMLIDYRDLYNLLPRLKTFIDYNSSSSETQQTEILQEFDLKPNVFGIGLNLNRILSRFISWFKNKQKPLT